ncbi:MAG: domain protein beta barrel domain protein [Actinomycetia bacterium]|nr:domain protein beta barrel domain protein [Actinomycetes bacterium]
MQVLELWRYPVKSLQGERLETAEVTADGLAGDRRFALFDSDTGLGLTARRVPELLFASARLLDDGGVRIELPGGSVAADDAALSEWLGRRVALRAADDVGARRYENPVEFEREATAEWEVFNGARGAFHDSARARVSLVSTGSLGEWDRRRFRSNVVLDGSGEDAFVGSTMDLGGCVLEVMKRIERCVMTTRAQPGGIGRDLDVLRTIHRERARCLAIGALVRRPGTLRTGDAVVVS